MSHPVDPRPSPCLGISPSGPDCASPSPAPAPEKEPVPAEGGGGAGVVVPVAGPADVVLDALPWALVAALLVVVVGLLVERARGRGRGRGRGRRAEVPVVRVPAVVPAPPAPVAATPPAAPAAAGPVAHPAALVPELLTLADLATTPAVASQVRRVLRELGVEPVEPAEGALLDLDRDQVVATVVTADPSLRDRVVRVVRPGWRRGAQVLRPAEVQTWTVAPPPPPPASEGDRRTTDEGS